MVGRPKGLAQHVIDPGLFEHGAGRAPSDHPGAGGGWLEKYPPGSHDAQDLMDDGAAGQWYIKQVPLRLLGALLDGQGHLLGLPVAEADPTGAVADHHQRGEREPATAFNDLGHPVDVDNPGLA